MQNIALQVTLNGIPTAVSNLKELELAIVQAREQLFSTTLPGTEQFKRFSAQIAAAESKLKDFKKQAEGKDLEGSLGDIGKLGGAIAGSFAAATAAVSLFGEENEDVTKAVTQAQNALTLALGARSAAEGLVVVKTVAANIATKALTASTQASTAATRAFYKVIAANPYGAIIAAVGALVTAIVLLNKEQSESEIQAEKAAEAQKKYEEAVKTAGVTAKLTANQVGFLFNEFEQGRLSLEEIEPFVRKFATGLQNVNLATKEGQSELRQYLTNLADLAIVQDRISAKQQEFTTAITDGNQARASAIRKEIEQLSLTAARYQRFVSEAEARDKKLGEEREKRLNQAAAREKKRIEDSIALSLMKLKADTLINGANTGIIETENDLIASLEKKLELLKSTASALDITRTFQDDLNDVNAATIQEADKFGATFTLIRKKAEEYYKEVAKGTITADKAGKALEKFRKETLANSDVIFSEQKQLQLAEYTKKYDDLYQILLKTSDIKPGEGFKDFGQQFEQAILDVALLEGKLQIDPFIGRSPERKAEARREAEAELEIVRKLYVDNFVEINKASQNFAQQTVENQAIILKDLEATGNASFEQLKNASLEVVKLENAVGLGALAITKLNKELGNTADLAKSGLILANKELLAIKFDIDFTNIETGKQRLLQLEEEIATERFDIEKKFVNDVEFLSYQLSQSVPEFAKLSYEAKLLILREFLKKEVDATEEAEKTKQEKIAKTISFIQDTIGQLQAALGAIQQTTAAFLDFQFEQLEKRYKRVQDTIVGDTEEANQKRLEAEKIYNAERERLEKRAAKIQLRISLAQTIANTAQAITAAFTAGPVIGQILGGIVAAASASQIVLINQQIAAVDSYKKGGMLRGMQTGGLVKGPSHEYGGVKFQGGGIELEGNESVINRVSTVRYQDLLNQINLNGGGAPIMNNFDDSRIVEAIASQRREPIRAYVVESDITSKQTIQKRLELLSQI